MELTKLSNETEKGGSLSDPLCNSYICANEAITPQQRPYLKKLNSREIGWKGRIVEEKIRLVGVWTHIASHFINARQEEVVNKDEISVPLSK